MDFSEIQKNFAIKNGYVGWHEIEDDHKLGDVCEEFAKYCLIVKDEHIGELGQLVDKIDNLYRALILPTNSQFQVDQMKLQLSKLSTDVKNIYTKLGGEYVWPIAFF